MTLYSNHRLTSPAHIPTSTSQLTGPGKSEVFNLFAGVYDKRDAT